MRSKFLLLLFLVFLIACSSDNGEVEENIDLGKPDVENPDIDGEPGQGPGENKESAGEVIVLDKDKVDGSFLLVNDAINNRVFIMNKQADILHEWQLESGIGNDCFLLDDGNLLALLQAKSPSIIFGGYGGNLQLVEPDNKVSWGFEISNSNEISHHDVEMLPNGNVLILVWVRKTEDQALEAGYKHKYDLFPESIYELDPEKMEIVWRWDSWDHLVQDNDESKMNYGVISENPHKIDINYNPMQNGDIMHANGIAYDHMKNLIYISVNFYSEIWVIDHSTSTEEAKESSGGNYNKGGDLLYRFGNPEAYKNPSGKRLFFNNHYPNLNIGGVNNSMFVFMNGNLLQQSIVYEFRIPEDFSLKPNSNNEPEIIWSYTNSDLYSSKVSGAEPLANGNILITEGDYGAWEVTREGLIVWKFKGDGFFWRIYPYKKDSAALSHFNL